MIPIELTIEGLYSYQERQTIDFETLTQAGLFGIFGSVGSGKSSILEAISFALYGKTERMNLRENRAYNMMNLKSNRLYIEFIFLNHENKKFKITRDFRRNSRNFNDIVNRDAVLYEEKNNEWIPLPDLDIENILGLSYENFKRTIIIPQGQFKEFLELGAAERTRMMKEIFNLQKYDLSKNTRILLKVNTSKLDHIEGKLTGYEEISKEKIDTFSETLNQKNDALEKEKEQHKNLEAAFRKIKNLREESKSFLSNVERFEKMKTQVSENEKLEKKIEQYDTFYKIFHQLIDQQKDLASEQLKLEKSKSESKEKLESIKKHIETLEKKKEEIQPKFDALEIEKLKANEFEIILKLKETQIKIETLKPRLKKGKTVIDEENGKLKALRDGLKKISEEEIELKKQRIDPQIIFKVSSWYDNKKRLTDDLHKFQDKKKEIENKIDECKEEIKDLGIVSETFTKEFNETLESFKKKISEFEAHKSHLELEQKLSEFSDELHHGKACPLCGSLEHPNKLSAKDLSKEIEEIIEQIDSINKQIDDWNQKKAKFERIQDLLEFHTKDLKNNNAELEKIKSQITTHQKTFQWKVFESNNKESFESKKERFQEIENQYNINRESFATAQENIEKQREYIDKCERAFAQLDTDYRDFKSQFKANELYLKHLDFKDHQSKDFEELKRISAELKSANVKIEEDFKAIENELNEFQLKLTASKTESNAFQHQLSELIDKKKIVENTIDEKLKEHQLIDIEKVKNILNEELDVQFIRRKITDFKVDFETLKTNIDAQKEKLKDFNLSEKAFEEKENEFNFSEEKLENLNKQVIEMTADLRRLTESFKEKEEILKEQEKLMKRDENLRNLDQLFIGAGFVQYVSSIYLRQLCDQANLRFHRMTKNQLSLQLNDRLDFEIIDYLNEGKSRSVKTLSGGQSFQVSLSLALALAENVQSKNMTDKNFFFIDEGFGTQDSDSVNIVFETLMQLQKENRMVGIISHVNELKEKIPMFLTIENDTEKGSLIQTSYE